MMQTAVYTEQRRTKSDGPIYVYNVGGNTNKWDKHACQIRVNQSFSPRSSETAPTNATPAQQTWSMWSSKPEVFMVELCFGALNDYLLENVMENSTESKSSLHRINSYCKVTCIPLDYWVKCVLPSSRVNCILLDCSRMMCIFLDCQITMQTSLQSTGPVTVHTANDIYKMKAVTNWKLRRVGKHVCLANEVLQRR